MDRRAEGDLRNRAPGARRRGRLLFSAVVATLLSVGATVSMASAAPWHLAASASPTSAPAAPAPAAPAPATPAAATPAPTPAPATPAPATAAPPPHPGAQVVATAASARVVATSAPLAAPPVSAPGPDTCSAALSYLSAHAAPGFHFECPGYALGHQAMTCVNVAGVCPGTDLIAISVVCPASYMNEAHNSWILSGRQTGSIDPYGYCH